MSFFDDASLAFLPSGAAGKDGKAYSIKPTDGTGDFTFSRGSNLAATRVGADGLIEKGRENLLLQSNQFDTTWTTTNASVTSGQSGYDGSSDAWLLSKSDLAGLLQQTVSSSSVSTFSVYLKAGTLNWAWIILRDSVGGNDAYIYLDLSGSGALGTSAGGAFVDANIVSIGSGWFRCDVKNSGGYDMVRIAPADGDGDLTGTSGNIYIQDSQVEIGTLATEVIESGATTGKAGLLEDEPRFDYSGGATCPSLLLEPSRTNLIKQSEYFGDGFWIKNDLNISIGFTSPDGLINASKLAATTSNSVHRMRTSTIVTPAVGTDVTFSIYCKPQEISKIALVDSWTGLTYSVVNLSTNSVIEENFYTGTGSTTITEMANGFKRISFNYETSSVNTLPSVYLLDDGYTSGNPASYTFASDGSSGVIAYGAQFELASYPTSYIPNHSGGSVTRGADVCDGAGDSSTFNDSEGVLYTEIAALANDGTNRAISLIKDNNNTISLFYFLTSNTIRALILNGGSTQVQIDFALSDTTDFNKIAFKYKENDVALYVNGVQVGTDTTATIPTDLNSLDFKYASNNFYGKVKQVVYFPEALSDTDLATLTTL